MPESTSVEQDVRTGRIARPELDVGLQPWFRNPHGHSAIEGVCRAGHVHLWSERVQKAFHDNAVQHTGGAIASWTALAEIVNRHRGTMTRLAHSPAQLGKNKNPQLPDAVLRNLVAWALAREDRELSPTIQEWIASSARFLLLKFRPSQRVVDTFEYAGFMMSEFVHYKSHSESATMMLHRYESAVGPNGVARVQETACLVGDVLIRQLQWPVK